MQTMQMADRAFFALAKALAARDRISFVGAEGPGLFGLLLVCLPPPAAELPSCTYTAGHGGPSHWSQAGIGDFR